MPDKPTDANFRWRIAIVEDHMLQRKATAALIARDRTLAVVWAGETLPELLAWLETCPPNRRPHLVVLDLMVERGPSVEAGQIKALAREGIRVLVLSAMASPRLVREVLRAGVDGVVGKRDSEHSILEAVWAVLERRSWMTPELASVIVTDANRPSLSDQEERSLVLYASGLTLDAVAEAINVRPNTVKKYLNRVKAKYSEAGRPVRSKIDLRRVADEDGYFDEGESDS